MPTIQINSNTLQFIISIFTIFAMSAAGVFWITDRVATKNDVQTLETNLTRQSTLQYMDVSIKVSETAMLIYESRADSLTVAEQRQYEILKSMHTTQLEAYREATNDL